MNGTADKVEIEEVDLCDDGRSLPGTELSLAHSLFCALRDEGFDESDIGKLVKAKPELLGYILGFLRGEVQLHDIPCELVNLDKHPGIKRDKKKKINLFRDLRLGTWLTDWSDGIKIAGKYVDIVRPRGLGLQSRGFFTRSTLNPEKNRDEYCIDLNAQAAKWFYENHKDATRNFFECVGRIAKSDEWNDDKIFFLGTLWSVDGVAHAMALVSDSEGYIYCRLEPLPSGDWPENCYIAVLVDNLEVLKSYK